MAPAPIGKRKHALVLADVLPPANERHVATSLPLASGAAPT